MLCPRNQPVRVVWVFGTSGSVKLDSDAPRSPWKQYRSEPRPSRRFLLRKPEYCGRSFSFPFVSKASIWGGGGNRYQFFSPHHRCSALNIFELVFNVDLHFRGSRAEATWDS
ncbi:hypothetical protein, unlikely [Trypanosoma brucei gambiense DAL972]|uniref:Uncharacterized protein n=1 Tax=Trypanosoma brucei gambiense (strain MHOM/CI/86/DAL972) TaxID=679716 RepID=D0AAV2_TRYB9|nr:hypothetical protein, unlikely [Trypanosoma brucei gambiense DAL972]CBH18803.1 hypothetical protein, unlikely [Trypanosoma brucei gambiense DAL972]|eukprot:XP_011781067.1 hypothetical protein, unlikely [Trypanosoma brucei gambiense DAL972]